MWPNSSMLTCFEIHSIYAFLPVTTDASLCHYFKLTRTVSVRSFLWSGSSLKWNIWFNHTAHSLSPELVFQVKPSIYFCSLNCYSHISVWKLDYMEQLLSAINLLKRIRGMWWGLSFKNISKVSCFAFEPIIPSSTYFTHPSCPSFIKEPPGWQHEKNYGEKKWIKCTLQGQKTKNWCDGEKRQERLFLTLNGSLVRRTSTKNKWIIEI